jgi:hypothetical protein
MLLAVAAAVVEHKIAWKNVLHLRHPRVLLFHHTVPMSQVYRFIHNILCLRLVLKMAP